MAETVALAPVPPPAPPVTAPPVTAQPAVAQPVTAPPAVAPSPTRPPGRLRAPSRAPARPARMRRRHWGILGSFCLAVLLPAGGVAAYMHGVALDQYASRTGFTVRQEEGVAAASLMSGLAALGGASSSDTDILYEFIQSQEMVRLADEALDLRAIYQAPGQVDEGLLGRLRADPAFALAPGASIEDLVAHWGRMTRVFYDPGTGLIEVEARAFDAADAQSVAALVLQASGDVINRISAVAREDMTAYARADLDASLERLRDARQALTLFRNETQIVDVGADLQGQMGVLNSLQGQLAEALVELDLLAGNAREDDSRVEQARLRISAIEARITGERDKVGGAGGRAFADLVGEFESLQVDLEFAEGSYLSARAAYDAALAEARRESRYLAAYVAPTLAETPQHPRRALTVALSALALFGAWAIAVLVAYSLKDRR